MNPNEKLMNGLLPMAVIFISFLIAIGLYKFFERRGNFAIFKTAAVTLGILGILVIIGRAMGWA